MAITASAVSELRKITNAGMMACKKALTETEGDLDAAVKLLREKGIVKSAGRSDRETSEGIVTAQVSDCAGNGVLVEFNCETDFVAKNDNFQAFASEITATIANSDVSEADAAVNLAHGESTVQEALGAKFTELGELIKIKRIVRFVAGSGAVGSYIHMGGKVGVLVEVTAENADTKSNATFNELLKDLCLHIAAANPTGLNRDGIDASVVEDENEINRKQLLAEGKPEQIIEKVLVGKINKFYGEQCLLEQAFVKDGDVTITQLLAAKGKEIGDTLTLARYSRYSVGA